jgi:hypothetical protein
LSRNQRFTLLGLAIVVLVVAFVVARSGNNDSSSSSSNDNAGTSTQSASDDNGTGGSTTPAKPATPTIVVKNAKPVGGIKRLTFKHNDRIIFVVKSDTADEIHFHGYDIGKDVDAGGSVRFNVKGTIEGRFEVELENHKEQIAEVEVTP